MDRQEARQLDREIRREIAGSFIWMPLGWRKAPGACTNDQQCCVNLYHFPKNTQVLIDSRQTWQDTKTRYGVHAPLHNFASYLSE